MTLRLLGWSLLAAALVVVGLALWSGWRSRGQHEMPAAPSFRPAVAGLEFEEFEGQDRRLAFSVTSVERRPRAVGPVTTRIEDVVFNGVVIEIETRPAETLPQAIVQSIRRTLDARDLEGVTRLDMHSLRLTELREGLPVFTLEAAGAQLEFGNPELRFHRLTLASLRNHQRFACREARWLQGSGLLQVDGPYLLEDQAETSARARTCFRIGPDRSIVREEC